MTPEVVRFLHKMAAANWCLFESTKYRLDDLNIQICEIANCELNDSATNCDYQQRIGG